MSTSQTPFPPSGRFVEYVSASCRALVESSGVKIPDDAILTVLNSVAFKTSFDRLANAHGLSFPLQFPSVHAEVNFLAVLSLLNFGGGYRTVLRAQTGRGAYDCIRMLLFSAFLDIDSPDSTGVGAMLFTTAGMREASAGAIASAIGLNLHVDHQHATIPGLTVGELGGPAYEFVSLIVQTLREAGAALAEIGHNDLGTFTLQCMREAAGDGNKLLEQLVRLIPGFRDTALVNGHPVYLFKKALFLINALHQRFENRKDIPLVDPTTLPVYSDNVLPSLLVHLRVIDLSESSASLSLAFTLQGDGGALLGAVPDQLGQKAVEVVEGPLLSAQDATILRAAAVVACERFVHVARSQLEMELTLPQIDAWLWSVAKDRPDYRSLPRFSLRNTMFF